MNKHLLTFYIVLLCQLTIAQNYYPPIINYSTKQYSTEYTMNPENFAVVQDFRGVMYFGNSNGVIEFDGQDWRFIEVILGNYVKSLAIDSSGVVYAGSHNDFGFFESNESNLLVYHSLSEQLSEENQYFSEINAIYANKTDVYFQAREAIYIYNVESKNVKTVKSETSFHTSYMVNGVFYVRQRELGILKWVNNELIILEGTQYLFGEFEGSGYGCFGIHKALNSDTLIIITQEIGMYNWFNGKLVPLMDPNNNDLNNLKLFNSIRLSDGNIALSTNTEGVFIINERGQILKRIDLSKGMRTNDVKSMFEDKDQNLWLGLGNGISKVNYYSPLSYYNDKSGIDGDVQAFIRFNGLLYVGTSFGLFVQNRNPKIKKEFVSIPFINDQVWDLKVYNSKLYIGTKEGVLEHTFSPNITEQSFKKISRPNTNKIFFHKDKGLVITAGDNGVYIWNNSYATVWSFKNKLSTILAIEQDPKDSDIIWIGTSSSGIIRLTLGSDYKIDQYGTFDGLLSDERAKPLLFEGGLIFGSSSGALKFIDEEEMKEGLGKEFKDDPDYYGGMFDVLPFYDSVFEEEILLIQEDENKTWLSAGHKIGFYSLNQKKFINKPFWGINYGRVNQFYLEDNGVLWVGCADGLIRYKENEQKKYKSIFSSLIRRVTVGKDSILFNGAAYQDTLSAVEVVHGYNDVEFRFASPYFEDEHIPKYSYILKGKDEHWSLLGERNIANYTNLSEGDYVFKVKAQNIYGNYSNVAYYRFTILPPWYRTFMAYIGYVIIFIAFVLIAIKISSKRLKAKNEWLEGVVEERTKEISEKNEVLEYKNDEISEQKREIEDSINYAKRIQTAILPLDNHMKSSLPNSFVLFRPKDIVSGDFYWYSRKGNKLVIVCADCTGHGVPGAFMSMIGSDRLNIIVNERHETSPGKILSELNRAIKNTLKQGGGKDSTKDGMDAAICTVDLDSNTMVYSGAYRPLWIIKEGELEEVKATKVAVAGFTADDQVYEEHIIKLEKGQKFYMTTDGYADQFGGVRGKKYKVKTLKSYLLSICNLPYDKQSKDLENEIVRWMESFEVNCEQIDDICIIGFEVAKIIEQ